MKGDFVYSTVCKNRVSTKRGIPPVPAWYDGLGKNAMRIQPVEEARPFYSSSAWSAPVAGLSPKVITQRTSKASHS